jgi:hypothetical protein
MAMNKFMKIMGIRIMNEMKYKYEKLVPHYLYPFISMSDGVWKDTHSMPLMYLW